MTERFMWGEDVAEDLSPQWSERQVAEMAALRPPVLTVGMGFQPNRLHTAPKMSIERAARMPRCHYLNVRLHPSVELKRGAARRASCWRRCSKRWTWMPSPTTWAGVSRWKSMPTSWKWD